MIPIREVLDIEEPHILGTYRSMSLLSSSQEVRWLKKPPGVWLALNRRRGSPEMIPDAHDVASPFCGMGVSLLADLGFQASQHPLRGVLEPASCLPAGGQGQR